MALSLPRHRRPLSTIWLESSLLTTLSLSCERYCCTHYFAMLALSACSSDTSWGSEPALGSPAAAPAQFIKALAVPEVSHTWAACRGDLCSVVHDISASAGNSWDKFL